MPPCWPALVVHKLYTAGQVRELLRRGIEAQVVTVGHGNKDGRKDFTDIPFLALKNASEISQLSGAIVFVNRAYNVPTKNRAAIILHCVTPRQTEREVRQAEVADKIVIATSFYNFNLVTSPDRTWKQFWEYGADKRQA